MINILLNILFYFFIYPLSMIFRFFGIVYVYNQYKTKNSYWIKNYKKTNNIPDTKYTLW